MKKSIGIDELETELKKLEEKVNKKSCSKKDFETIKRKYQELKTKSQVCQQRALQIQNQGYINLDGLVSLGNLIHKIQDPAFQDKIDNIEISNKGCL